MNTPTNKRRRRKARRAPRPEGRPTAYRAQYAVMVFGFAVAGYTDKEMAGYFGVCEKTFHTWKLKHPKFLQSIEAGKMPANGKAAARVFDLVMGYTRPAVKIFQSEGASFEHEYLEYYPPDPGTVRWFMQNRMPDKWKSKHEAVVTDPNGANPFDTLAVEIAKQIVKERG